MGRYIARSTRGLAVLAVITTISIALGCQTGAQTGALAGGGIGALAGQAIGGDTGATLIGAAVGAGVGYIIGNEQDKKHAQELQDAQSTEPPTHDEVGALGGTRWRLVSLNPRDAAAAYASKVVDFRPNGRVMTTTTSADGSVSTSDETYRVVGSALIVNKPGYLINARFAVSGNQLTISATDFSAVLERL